VNQKSLKALNLPKSRDRLDYLSFEELSLCGPCIIWISNFDDLLHSETAEAEQTQHAAPPETKLDLFLNSYGTLLENSRRSQMSFPVIIIGVSSIPNIPVNLQNIFSVISMENDSSHAHVKEKLILDDSNLLNDHLLLQLINVNTSLQKIISCSWIRESLVLSLNSPDYRFSEFKNGIDFSLRIDNKLLPRLIRKTILLSEELADHQDRFSSAVSQVSPVYWEDIGGLDRFIILL
jgi:hypothetical protein